MDGENYSFERGNEFRNTILMGREERGRHSLQGNNIKKGGKVC